MGRDDEAGRNACPVCASESMRAVVSIENLPVHVGVLWPTAEAARSCPTGDMELAFCPACGLLTNTAFDETLTDYTLEYDNSLHSSAVFRDFESGLVDDLTERHRLRGGRIVEIGCGDGHFLRLLCDAAGATGEGFDPSIGRDRTLDGGRVELRARHFGPDTDLGRVDLLCCRQVLEHITEPVPFLAAIAAALSRAGGVTAYLDVPNSTMLLDELSIWDLVYEHCHYFLDPSLRALVAAAGLTVERSWTSFGDQFLSMEVTAGAPGGPPGDAVPGPADLDAVAKRVDDFAARVDERRRSWSRRLDDEGSAGRRIVVWGAGARAVSFFSMVGSSSDHVAYLVDANPRKQGTHLAGTGHAIRPPSDLSAEPPDLVVLLNGIYEAEIREQLKELGCAPTVVVA